MQVYIVGGSSGDYSDNTEWTICVCQQEATAERLVKELIELQEFDNAFAKRVREEFEAQYKHETPMLPHPEKPAMSAELRSLQGRGKKEGRVKALFKELHDQFMADINVWHKECEEVGKHNSELYWKQEAAKKNWIASNYNPSPHLQEAIRLTGRDIVSTYTYRVYSNNDYSHYAVELIEG